MPDTNKPKSLHAVLAEQRLLGKWPAGIIDPRNVTLEKVVALVTPKKGLAT
jgi:hypothetical protein